MVTLARRAAVSLTVLAIGFVALSGLSTSRASISASTTNENNVWTAGTLELEMDRVSRLFIDAGNVYPGIRLERCIPVTYGGSIDGADVRLFGELMPNGTNLEEFLVLNIETGTGTDSTCADFEPTASLWLGSMAELWELHASYNQGVRIIEDAVTDETLTLRVQLSVLDDNAAQGLTTNFNAVLEVRP